MLQAKPGRSGKQQQQHNSPNLIPVPQREAGRRTGINGTKGETKRASVQRTEGETQSNEMRRTDGRGAGEKSSVIVAKLFLRLRRSDSDLRAPIRPVHE